MHMYMHIHVTKCTYVQSLVVNDQFLPAFWSFLGRDDYVEEASACLTEIALKKMGTFAARGDVHVVCVSEFEESCVYERCACGVCV